MTYKGIKIISIGCGTHIIKSSNDERIETTVKRYLHEIGFNISQYHINNWIDDYVNVDCYVTKVKDLYKTLERKYKNALISFSLEKCVKDDSEDNGFNFKEISYEEYEKQINEGIIKF